MKFESSRQTCWQLIIIGVDVRSYELEPFAPFFKKNFLFLPSPSNAILSSRASQPTAMQNSFGLIFKDL